MYSAKRLRAVGKLPTSALAVSVGFLIGMLTGFLLARQSVPEVGDQLTRYWAGSAALLPTGAASAESAVRTLLCFWRTPAMLFLLGFLSAGLFLVPLLCAAQGFLLTYSFCAFAAILGDGSFPLLLLLFAARLLILLPTVLLCAGIAWERSRSTAIGRPGKKRDYLLRFAFLGVILFLGATVEFRLIPHCIAKLL